MKRNRQNSSKTPTSSKITKKAASWEDSESAGVVLLSKAMERRNSSETPTSSKITKEAASYRGGEEATVSKNRYLKGDDKEERLEDVFQDEIIKAFFNITSFQRFARSKDGLCLDQFVINTIVEDHRANVEDQKMETLFKWKEIQGKAATVSEIRCLLRRYLKGDDKGERFEDVFEDEIIMALVDIISFKRFARSKNGLCLDEHIIQQIAEDHKEEEQKLQMLNKWREITGEEAKISKLRYLLRRYLREDDKGEYIILENGIYGMYKNHVLCKQAHVFLGEQTSEVTGTYICAIKLRQNNKESLREAKILSKLRNHVNVVSILHAGICRLGPIDYIYVAMELSWTDTVRNMLEDSERLGIPFNEFISMNLVRQILTALDFIHSNNIIHRDLKPENILLSKDWSQSKVTDFGISKAITDGHSTRQTNANIGTDGYRAQESYITNATITLKSDIFSAGITIAEIFSNGKHPFGEEQLLWSFNIKMNKNLDLSHFLVPQMMNLIKRMLEMDPEKRPTAEEGLNEVQQCQTSSQPKNQQTTADQSSATSSMTQLQPPTAEKVQQYQTSYQPNNQQTTDDQSSATSSMTQLSTTEKANAIIMFNESDNLMYSYKLANKKWNRMQDFAKFSTSLHFIKSYFTTVVSGKHIYVLHQEEVYQLEYSDSAAKWKQVSSMSEQHGFWPPAAMLNGSIYVCGKRGMSGATKSVERYDADSDRWDRLCGINIQRLSPHVVASKDHIYCMGGFPIKSVERFDEKLNKWELVAPLPRSIHWRASAAAVKNRIYAADLEGVLCYNIQNNSWSEINLSNQWPFVKYLNPKILAINEELYLIGDCSEKKTTQRIYLLEPETSRMTLVEEFNDKWSYNVGVSLAVEL